MPALPRRPPFVHLFAGGSVTFAVCISFCHILFCFRQIERCSSEALQIVLTSAQFVICTLIYRYFAVRRRAVGASPPVAVRLRISEDLHFVSGAFIFDSVCLTQMCLGLLGSGAASQMAPDKCTNLVLRAWPACQYLHNVRLSFIFFYFFTVAPLNFPPGRHIFIFQLFWRLPEFDCLPLFAWNKMLWLMAWLQRHFPILFILVLGWLCSVLHIFFFLGEVSRCPSSISFVCAL